MVIKAVITNQIDYHYLNLGWHKGSVLGGLMMGGVGGDLAGGFW